MGRRRGTTALGSLSTAAAIGDVLQAAQGVKVQETLESAGFFLKEVEGIELAAVLQQLAGLVGAAWGLVTSPFAIFGPDMPLVNGLFTLTSLMLAYGLIVKAPRQ